MTQLNTITTSCSILILTSCWLHSSHYNQIYTVWSKYRTLKISIITNLYVKLGPHLQTKHSRMVLIQFV